MSFIISLVLLSVVHQSGFCEKLEADITLFPAGSFVAKTDDVKGVAFLRGDQVLAKDIKVNLKTIKTGIALRDSHTQKYLETEKYPEAVLLKAVGKNGKGKAQIRFRQKEEVVEGTYTISKDKKTLEARFPLSLAKFGITGIKYMGVGVQDETVVRLKLPLKEVK